ncbi:MAG TPA: tetratricopeptide repeat protein [Kofleriaceae bacterium]|jgi:tetratricopeptide (TPR) repeat protein|nr:tetratricopeptide repeat protein [Kofleriaceae bacterium]
MTTDAITTPSNSRPCFAAAAAALIGLAACGGGAGARASARGSTVPPPPKVTKSEAAAAREQPRREVSRDTRSDFDSAVQAFTATDKAHGWSDSTCRQSADRFQAVARAHPELVEAMAMVGVSYQRCAMYEDAERAYRQVLQTKPNHGASLSNLGEIYFRTGRAGEARQYWDSAIKANGRLVGARIGIATLELEQMRKIANPKDATWKKLEEDARFNLSNALGADSDNVPAYTVYGLVYMEGSQANKNRLDLAKLLLDEAAKRNEKYAPLQNAYGLLYLRRASLNQALAAFNAAVDIDPRFVEARMNVGQVTLGFRKYDTARDMFSKAIELSPKNYDAYIGLGIALRGLKDLDGAEAQYKKAMELDARRGEAYYNLAILYKEFRSSKDDFIASYKKAKEYFQQFLTMQADQADKNEAKEQIAMIDKTVQNFMKAPPPPPAAPAAAPAKQP